MKTYMLLPILLLAGCAMQAESSDEPRSQVQALESCQTLGEIQECVTDSGAPGARRCQASAEFDYEPFFSDCGDTSVCSPGDSVSCGFEVEYLAGLSRSCALKDDGTWGYDEFGCNTPLVLNFSGGPVEFTRAGGHFELLGGDAPVSHDWVSADTPWLVLDRDLNGTIDDGRELFGSMTRLANGQRATNGFAALAELDKNQDGRIDAADPDFSRLMLWRDTDQNRASDATELSSIQQSGVQSLALAYDNVPRCTSTSCEMERAGFEFIDPSGQVERGTTIDVHFRSY